MNKTSVLVWLRNAIAYPGAKTGIGDVSEGGGDKRGTLPASSDAGRLMRLEALDPEVIGASLPGIATALLRQRLQRRRMRIGIGQAVRRRDAQRLTAGRHSR